MKCYREISARGLKIMSHKGAVVEMELLKLKKRKREKNLLIYNMCRVFYSVTSELERANSYLGLVNHT